MVRAPKISIQFKVDAEEQCSSGTILVADRVVRNLEPNVCGEPESPVILVVDDDEELRESLVRLLAECDLTAVGAASSLNALEILQHSRVDVVVSDHFAGGIDGVSLLSEVRQRWPHVQRILLMAEAAPDVVVDAVNRAGVHKMLLKNMHAVQIRDEIEGVALDALRQRLSVLQV
jgi:CheY-like chemotaxis protein